MSTLVKQYRIIVKQMLKCSYKYQFLYFIFYILWIVLVIKDPRVTWQKLAVHRLRTTGINHK
jgi:hypothetical protein